MPQSTRQKGNYHRRRTKEWLENEGYSVSVVEVSYRVYDKKTGNVIFRTGDVFGADLLAIDGEQIAAVQVKANASHIAKGIRELHAHPWPECVNLWVAHWPEHRRMTVGPDIYDARRDDRRRYQ